MSKSSCRVAASEFGPLVIYQGDPVLPPEPLDLGLNGRPLVLKYSLGGAVLVVIYRNAKNTAMSGCAISARID